MKLVSEYRVIRKRLYQVVPFIVSQIEMSRVQKEIAINGY